MDSKRPHKYRALRQICYIVCILLMSACTWVKDERDDCPEGFWLKLNYTYNLLDIEAAQKYVTDASVYIFDADGKFAKSMYVNHTQLINNGYRINKIVVGAAQGFENADAAVKAEKFYRNGQLIIRKNGVEYNALGAQL